MIDPADLVAALRKVVESSGAPLPPEVTQVLDELSPKLGEADPGRFRAALAEALPELRAMQARVGSAAAQSGAAAPPPDPERAMALLAQLSRAWVDRDGDSVDAVLDDLNESRVQMDETDRQRIRDEVRGAIAAHMSDLRLKGFGEG